MWDYIVLGQVPGTSVQITFAAWLFAMASLTVVGLTYILVRKALSLPNNGTRTATNVPTVKHVAILTQLLIAVQVTRVIRTAAYSRMLITRQQFSA